MEKKVTIEITEKQLLSLWVLWNVEDYEQWDVLDELCDDLGISTPNNKEMEKIADRLMMEINLFLNPPNK